jgi:basic amino acid/polyamine antiporter, APA family
VISFIIAGIGCMFAGLCYSEFAAMVPVAGSAYAYSYATLGELVAWFVGWNLILEYMMACSTVAAGWSGYFIKLLEHFHVNFIPAALSSAPFETSGPGIQFHATGAYVNLPAIVIIAAATWLCYRGIKESAVVNTIIVAVKVCIVLAVIVFGAFYVNTAHWFPYIPANTGEFGHFGWSGIFQASAIIFFAYIGFDGVSTVAQEAKDPQRGMPIGMLGSLAICTVLYILMSSVLTGLVPFQTLNGAAPVAVALEAHPQLSWLSFWVILGALFGLTSVIITMIIPQARIWLTMSHDGLLPKVFGSVHPKYRTPHVSTLITGVAASLAAGLVPLGVLGELVSIGTLIAFIVVCIGVLVLRYTRPDLPRPFRIKGVWGVSLLGVLFCSGMAYSLPNETWWRLLVWSAIGIFMYLVYGYRHSKLRGSAEAEGRDAAELTTGRR